MHAGPRGERATRPTNDHDIGDACSWGRPHKHIDRTALRLPQSSARRRPSAMAPICRQFRRATPSWVLLCAGPITHQSYISHFNSTVNSPMGPGLTNAMEPGSHPSWHTNRTPGAQFGPGGALQSFMACNGWTRLRTENNTDATASSPVSRVQPTPCQSCAIHTNQTLTYGPLLAGITDATITAQGAAVYILQAIIRLGQYGTRR